MVGRIPGVPYGGFYGASKHALSALSESLAFEAGPLGIRVVCVEPDQVPTEMFVKRRQESVDPKDPYAADHAWAERHAWESSRDPSCPAPSEVADAVVRAVLDPQCPLHVLVGENCKQVLDVAQQCATYEQWGGAVTQLMESTVGPRPLPPRAGR
jgi:NAD(P)-dependent dehydrogenase (short-subunit alcohol dehydrogenase family)